MAFSHKEACPKCRELGQDKAGDNLARYTNGSAFCFSCRYMEKPTHYRPAVVKETQAPPDDLTLLFDGENLKWLRQFLNSSEIADHFRYSPSLQRHVYQTGEYWEARSVNKQPKVLSHGSKPFVLFGKGNPIVVVEDVVSAIKVARVATAIPLFGAHFPSEWMVRIAKMQPESVVIWLDMDKAKTSRDYAYKFNALRSCARPVATVEDPKVYDEDNIKLILGIKDA